VQFPTGGIVRDSSGFAGRLNWLNSSTDSKVWMVEEMSYRYIISTASGRSGWRL